MRRHVFRESAYVVSVPGSGYYADVCVSRPTSRGRLRLGRDPFSPDIDLGLLTRPHDLEILRHGFRRLRCLLAEAPFGDRRAPEVYPAGEMTDDEIDNYIRAHCGTSYHPVGTLRMGTGAAPVATDLSVRSLDRLWIADASIMPEVTSANTNAASMMIGFRAGQMIAGKTQGYSHG